MEETQTLVQKVELALARIERRQARLPKRDLSFHIARRVREICQLDDEIFQLSGNVVLHDTQAVRRLAQQINERRVLGERGVRPAELNAMGLIDEILHYLVALYREIVDPMLSEKWLAHLTAACGVAAVDQTLTSFVAQYPPQAVYSASETGERYLAGESDGVPHRQLLLEELLLLSLANENPAFAPFCPLFSHDVLRKQSAYDQILQETERFMGAMPGFGFGGQSVSLVEMLRAPARHSPHSLKGQLLFMRQHWGLLIRKYSGRLLLSEDLIDEEIRPRQAGPGPSEVLRFDGTLGALSEDVEAFTPDRDWMPRVVMLAKSTHVWLAQLSAFYQTAIDRLDQIPDAELDRCAGWGFNCLWLIGLWQRSVASKEMKRRCGNPEAESSAYAVVDYRIADDLGGEGAFEILKQRCATRGIRLAGDMVPNHTALDSEWVMAHPDWFVQLDHPPFPSYAYDGPDLSTHQRAAVRIEDGYWAQSDAAVTFQWIDRQNGETRYIYHGNDGTQMPWNDTAQLDFLKSAVRSAVSDTIMHVARMFPVIRFDAAMILTKQHYSRLWYPPPGGGGAIPSRAEHGRAIDAFNEAFPREFWREVVDRINREAPDTLLLAEAFWLLEGYFVRNLGMHRVYNSAFMNMLKDEENDKYRQVLKNILAYDPQIIQRFVNFMNNPDEEPAAVQFGAGDKYIGVCTLMVTMPGLPMFGHGQVEGFHEKYGMEYRRAYWQETMNQELVARHEREIFPLVRRRYLFSGAADFNLFDVRDTEGAVCEDLFAYSNRHGDERVLVCYLNRLELGGGWVQQACPRRSAGEGYSQTLSEALGLETGKRLYYCLTEQRSDLTFLRHSEQLAAEGLFVMLDGYQSQVYAGFRRVVDEDGVVERLHAELDGRGVPDLDRALRLVRYRGLHEDLRSVLSLEVVRARFSAADETLVAAAADVVPGLRALSEENGVEPSALALAFMDHVGRAGACWRCLEELDLEHPLLAALTEEPPEVVRRRLMLLALLEALIDLSAEDANQRPVSQNVADFVLQSELGCLIGESEERVSWDAALLASMVRDRAAAVPGEDQDLQRVIDAPGTELLLGVSQHGGEAYVHKESYQAWLAWLLVSAALSHPVAVIAGESDAESCCDAIASRFSELAARAVAAGYRRAYLSVKI